jgi:hypothetical protein
MSRNISVTAVLVALLLLATVLFGAFAVTYARVHNAVVAHQTYARALEAQSIMIARNRAVFASIVNDAREYSKKSPAMGALLQQYTASLEQLGLVAKAAEPAASKPTSP